MITVDEAAIIAAFRQYHDNHPAADIIDDLRCQAKLWRVAGESFRSKSFSQFQVLYDELRGRIPWQVFRGAGAAMSALEVFSELNRANGEFMQSRLSELTIDNSGGLWAILSRLRNIKKTAKGPAIGAMSRFLHFYNPRLFVIFPANVMWEWVLKHGWIKEQVLRNRKQIESRHPEIRDPDDMGISAYIATLVWAGDLLRNNPAIAATFSGLARKRYAGMSLPQDVDSYESLAAEWFLVGLVDLPPGGVHLE